MNQNDGKMGMCMEVAGLESVEGLDAGPRMVGDNMEMHDNLRTTDGRLIRQAASGCEAYGMETD